MFEIQIPVRFLDMNAGQHVSLHKIIDYSIEAISLFFINKGHCINSFFKKSFIVSKTSINCKKEILYPNQLTITLTPKKVRDKSFYFDISIKDECEILCATVNFVGAFLDKKKQACYISDEMTSTLLDSKL
ncbi:acyl-CoA thioesterase [Vibrio sp.]|uniref:acyl-CoA thioesterase n=1 Tax=Vibrio sp. TaxID=678 RepID=UPI00311F758C